VGQVALQPGIDRAAGTWGMTRFGVRMIPSPDTSFGDGLSQRDKHHLNTIPAVAQALNFGRPFMACRFVDEKAARRRKRSRQKFPDMTC
jgi:hypothetical protein